MDDPTISGTIPGFTSNTATINGVRLHYFLGGSPSGIPLLLWHGFMGTSYSWHKVAPLLAGAGYSMKTGCRIRQPEVAQKEWVVTQLIPSSE
jgi:hypothetical protein